MDLRLALLLACFFLSGFAALLYQTAWTRELSFVFGTSELAVAAVLAAYMGGLALGAAVAARFANRLRRPVLVYGILELAIALSALSVPAGIRLISGVYVGLLGGVSDLPTLAAPAVGFQLAAAFAVLLPPTAFMGATLPLLARHAVRREEEIGSRVGLLYAVNTAGAIAGTLCAAFWLMPEVGLRRTVWVGASLNAAVFALAALLARSAAAAPAAAGPPRGPRSTASGAGWILPAIAVSGAVSFAYEVLWTRLLGHLLGSSVQAFATMLGSFLLGIALGSAAAARIATSRRRATAGFGAAQLGIGVASYAALALADTLPGLSQRLGAGPGAPVASAGIAIAVLLPITLCIGATFPFAVRILARDADEAARATARVYAWNTLGAIAGALGAGFVLLPGLGFAGTLSLGVVSNLGLAVLAALRARPRRSGLAILAAAAAAGLLVAPPERPWTLLRTSPMTGRAAVGEVRYAAVGRSSSVLLLDQGADLRLYTNGLPEAAIEVPGTLLEARTARWLGLLPGLLRPEARDLLVVGLGGGMVLESVPSSLHRIEVIELEPEVWVANQRVAGERALDPLSDPRVEVHIGDARGALRLSRKSYDAVVSQPSHPWTAGSSHLYTREFFDLVRSRLEPDGVFVQWVGLAFVDEPLLRSLAATVLEVFPYAELYRPRSAPGLIFAASRQPLGLDGPGRVLRDPPDDYTRFGIHRVEDLASIRLLDTAGLKALARGAELNTDDHNLLASRASGLGGSALVGNEPAIRALLDPIDPLRRSLGGLDRFVLVRTLVDQNFAGRATAVALGGEGATEAACLGWIDLGRSRGARAERHFLRALEGAEDAREGAEARAGLLASRGPGAVPPSGLSPPDEAAGEADEAAGEAPLIALETAWRHARASEWQAVAALEAALRDFEPGEPLFEQATRLRARWRLASEDRQAAAEALTLAETLLLRRWSVADALLRAEAATAAGRVDAARAELNRLSDELPKQPRRRELARRALAIAEALPGEESGKVRERLGRLAAAP